ncbi:MAG: hypothetical protein N2318_10895 [Meiothermus sp.]|nr:hypothetical protein [Meiothermus sp.]
MPNFVPGQLIAASSPVHPTDISIMKVMPDGKTAIAVELIDAQNHTLGSDHGFGVTGKPVPIPNNARPCPQEWAELVKKHSKNRHLL